MAKSTKPRKHSKPKHPQKEKKPHSWAAVRSLFTCKYLHVQQQQQLVQHHHQKKSQKQKLPEESEKCKKQGIKKEQTLEEMDKKCKKQGIKKEQALEEMDQKCMKQGIKKEQILREMDKRCKKQGIQEEQILEEMDQKCKKQGIKKEQTLEEMDKKCKKQGTLEEMEKKSKKLKCSGSLCSNTKVMQKPEISPSEEQKKRARLMGSESDGSSRSMRTVSLNVTSSSSSPSISGSFRNMPFRKLSGCYECRMVVDPVLGMTRDPSLRNSICSCPVCGEIFMKPENLEHHQAVRHAVSELGPEDTSKNIVEIIFQSSWLKKQAPVCKIDRILKVQNTPKTISKFEEYRDSIKIKATRLAKKHPRCLADGNELLRFHCTTLMCSLGLNGSSNLCNSIPTCSVCSIIKNGFKVRSQISSKGILTTASSGKAHDNCRVAINEGKRAMLVCRVIAGRVKKNPEGELEDYDSVAGAAGVYSNLDELYVFNAKAILPCFVVIYRGF